MEPLDIPSFVDKPVENVKNRGLIPIWETLKTTLKGKVSDINYNNWIQPISGAELVGDHLVLQVPNKFISDWITDYYIELIEQEALLALGREASVRFEIVLGQEKEAVLKANGESNGRPKENISTSPPNFVPSREARVVQKAPFNEKNSFDGFVVGPGNRLAHAAAKSAAELPGGHYNPLFFYGGVGLGKTHLLTAIGLEVWKKYPDFRILYISSEKFMNDFITAVRHDRMGMFRKKYRESCDMLLIDDIQFIGGKEGTQDEFFHTFNALHDSQRQIVLTSDKIPKEIPGLEARLRSRFEWGLIADVQAPDLETRVAILKKKASGEGVFLRDDVALYLASEVKHNVRELEGALIRLNAFASLTKASITIDLAKEVLKSILPAQSGEALATSATTVETIQKAVAEFYQIRIADLKSPRRLKSLAYPRQIAMYLCKKHLKVSYPEIGQRFGGKDHTTVIHGCRKIERLLNQDPHLQNDISILEKSILH